MEKTCDFQINQNGIHYIINLGIVDNYLQINCYESQNNNNNIIFFGQYLHEQLKQYSPTFNLTNSIEEDFLIFKRAIESGKVKIQKNENNELNLIFTFENVEDEFIDNPPEFNINFNNPSIEIFPARRLRTIRVKGDTINIRRPTIYIDGDNNEILKNNFNNNLFYSQNVGHNFPIINNSDIIHNKTYIQQNHHNYRYMTPEKVKHNARYNSPANSPVFEKIEYINNGSPSKNEYNYTYYHKNMNSPLKNNNVRMNNFAVVKSIQSELSTSNSDELEEKDSQIKKLLFELNENKKKFGELNLKIEKLSSIVDNLNKNNILLKNENNILKQNQSNQPDSALIKKQLTDEINKNKKEYEEYIKKKEEEIASYRNKFEQLMSQINILDKENAQLKVDLMKSTELLKHRNGKKLRLVKGEIIQDNKELIFLTQRICKNNKKITLNLLYKATVDSDKASAFHHKCDNSPSTLVLVKSSNGKRFGGYTTCSWSGDKEEKNDENAFVFSLDKMKIYDIIEGEEAIKCYPTFGPIFSGCQIRIFDNAFKEGGSTFEKGSNYKTEEDFELTGGIQKFGVEEIEVYGVDIEN